MRCKVVPRIASIFDNHPQVELGSCWKQGLQSKRRDGTCRSLKYTDITVQYCTGIPETAPSTVGKIELTLIGDRFIILPLEICKRIINGPMPSR